MSILNIKLSKNELNNFVNLASSFDSDIDLINGHNFIDAKSILGIFSLDISRNFQLKINDKNEEELSRFYNVFNKYIVN